MSFGVYLLTVDPIYFYLFKSVLSSFVYSLHYSIIRTPFCVYFHFLFSHYSSALLFTLWLVFFAFLHCFIYSSSLLSHWLPTLFLIPSIFFCFIIYFTVFYLCHNFLSPLLSFWSCISSLFGSFCSENICVLLFICLPVWGSAHKNSRTGLTDFFLNEIWPLENVPKCVFAF